MGTGWRRWGLRLGLVAVPLAAFAILRPGPFSATVRTPEAWLRIGAVGVGFTLLSLGVRRLVGNVWLQRAIVWIPLGAFLWWAVSPYFYGDKTANRTIMDAVAAEERGSPPESATTTTTTTSLPTSVPTPTPTPTTTTTTAPPPSEPVRLTTGTVRGLAGHRASGGASIYRLPGGTVVVQLEGIDIEAGPDYFLYLMPGRDRDDPDGGVNLGGLRANKGNDFYELGPDAEALLSGDVTVLVWCRTFAVPVAAATQEPA